MAAENSAIEYAAFLDLLTRCEIVMNYLSSGHSLPAKFPGAPEGNLTVKDKKFVLIIAPPYQELVVEMTVVDYIELVWQLTTAQIENLRRST